ncbi:MAG: energy-coupling factor ABC transporter permease [Fusobacteriaceae bacterium]|jgi:cobalt/nickel transport system permease protein|nr:energy-coupling factor ABC transporter permease [Fusobacteriaceae bacterium]
MHMADALLSPAVGGMMCAVSSACAGISVAKIKKDEFSEKKVPLMAMAGAFVFAGQMINFTIPATGSSGHIGGGILLSALIGGYPAFLTMAAVLLIQCLFFADGGLLALGSNIFNMGAIPCLLIWPLLVRPILKNGFTTKKINLTAILGVVMSLQLGAFAVVAETKASGITALPFGTFLLLMLPIHLAIGLVEGVVTGLILNFVRKMRPEILESAVRQKALDGAISFKKVLAVLGVFTVITGGLLSLFASGLPDGLEWSIAKITGTTELEREDPVLESAAKIQEKSAILPDYTFKDAGDEGNAAGTSLSGILGGVFVFALAGGTGFLIATLKKQKRKQED